MKIKVDKENEVLEDIIELVATASCGGGGG